MSEFFTFFPFCWWFLCRYSTRRTRLWKHSIKAFSHRFWVRGWLRLKFKSYKSMFKKNRRSFKSKQLYVRFRGRLRNKLVFMTPSHHLLRTIVCALNFCMDAKFDVRFSVISESHLRDPNCSKGWPSQFSSQHAGSVWPDWTKIRIYYQVLTLETQTSTTALQWVETRSSC